MQEARAGDGPTSRQLRDRAASLAAAAHAETELPAARVRLAAALAEQDAARTRLAAAHTALIRNWPERLAAAIADDVDTHPGRWNLHGKETSRAASSSEVVSPTRLPPTMRTGTS